MIARIESRPETIGGCKVADEFSAKELEVAIDNAIRKHEDFIFEFDYEHNRPASAPKIIFQANRFTVKALAQVLPMYRDAGWNIEMFGTEFHIQW